MTDEKYTMTLGLNVLNHLGLGLYSNIPAVLSEVVANAWDADAENVDVSIADGKIVVTDDGHGMTEKDINEKYLLVGYERRKEKGRETTPNHHRPVMGRKGIGKLSLFSIADMIEVRTMKDGQKSGFLMSAKKIKEQLEGQDNSPYHPDPISESEIQLNSHGTQITLSELKKGTGETAAKLRKRLARRFSIIGSEYKFLVTVDGTPISVDDRDYFHKLQYLWYYGKDSAKYEGYCKKGKLAQKLERDAEIEGTDYVVSGWIGTAEKSGDLQDGEDNLNKIVIIVRGKLAQEDILQEFGEGGLYTKYLIGEIHADFLDVNDKDDSATSSRQEIMKDDPRYVALKEWVKGELKFVQSSWTGLRNEGGTQQALIIPAINQWFSELGKDDKSRAKSLFGKINQLPVDSDDQRRELFKHGVLAFESFKYKRNLDALDKVAPENIQAITEVFAELDDIEATLYYQIVKERLQVIKTLQDKTKENALEKVVQQHLYDHLWLLDPSWDRATETPLLEQQVKKAFDELDAKLSDEEKLGRFDIKYKTTSGKHIIIELKRAERTVNSFDLGKQVTKYYAALEKELKMAGKAHEPIEVVCLVGKKCSDWVDDKNEEASRKMLDTRHVRVVTYQQLIEDAYRAYEAFLKKTEEAGRVQRLIQSIEGDGSAPE
jgi:hypothetical protein